jgi:hypothetical protein
MCQRNVLHFDKELSIQWESCESGRIRCDITATAIKQMAGVVKMSVA